MVQSFRPPRAREPVGVVFGCDPRLVRVPSKTFWQYLLLAGAFAGLGAGGALWLAGAADASAWVWAATTAVVLLPTALAAGAGIIRRETGVDLVAVLAMVGALILGEYLAGAIIALMLTGGTALERYAVARARRELTALLSRAPRVAHRRDGDDIVSVDVSEVELRDLLVVKPGEVIPADGILMSAEAVLDESALTGESRPVKLELGEPVRSGGTNAGGPFELRVTAPPSESTYAGIIRLVRDAEESKAPLARLADRFALGFVGLTLVLAAFAWAIGGPIRALAVLVVATPCPLILAAPAAIIAGVSRAARQGVIVKGGGPLEILAKARVLLLDKTGTVTSARPQVVAVETFDAQSSDELVRLAASLEQVSLHPFAPAILAEARDRGLDLVFPAAVTEKMGSGVSGTIDGVEVAIGQLAHVAPGAPRTEALRSVELRTLVEGSSSVFVAVDGALAGALLLHDPLRPEASRVLREMRKRGFQRIHVVTGDHPDVAELVGDALGVDRVYAERTPEEKTEVIRLVRREGITAMVGDGINDAPALALADVGIAMGARGATAASEAADIVLTGDRLEGLVVASSIAQRTRRIALESIVVGMGLSVIAMFAAAAGYLAPVTGAVLQEVIDVVVIANALRALGGGRVLGRRRDGAAEVAREMTSEHKNLRPRVGELAALASRLDSLEPAEALRQLRELHSMLVNELLPHEREEQRTAYPLLGDLLRDEDPTGPLIQTHHEIHRLTRLLGRLIDQVVPGGPGPADIRDLRRVLFGLHAILSLHFAQEEELFSLL